MTLGAISLISLLTGCTTLAAPALPASPDRLSIARNGCFGFCPVYLIRTLGSSEAEFSGIRHTKTLGTIKRSVSPSGLALLRHDLETYRPAEDAIFVCENTASDQSSYEVTWTQTGKKTVTLRFDSGCTTPAGARLKAILLSAPERLGFAADAAQITRPGASRG